MNNHLKKSAKDHKAAKKDEEFPTRLVAPTTNFTAGFPRLGYLGIRKIFDNKNIIYDNKTLVQASDFKKELESLKLKSKDTTVISLDVKAMYPSIKFNVVRKAVEYFAKDSNDEELQTK